MIIAGKEYDQVIITKNESGRVETDKGTVVAVISDDDELIVKDGYDIELVFAEEN